MREQQLSLRAGDLCDDLLRIGTHRIEERAAAFFARQHGVDHLGPHIGGRLPPAFEEHALDLRRGRVRQRANGRNLHGRGLAGIHQFRQHVERASATQAAREIDFDDLYRLGLACNRETLRRQHRDALLIEVPDVPVRGAVDHQQHAQHHGKTGDDDEQIAGEA